MRNKKKILAEVKEVDWSTEEDPEAVFYSVECHDGTLCICINKALAEAICGLINNGTINLFHINNSNEVVS